MDVVEFGVIFEKCHNNLRLCFLRLSTSCFKKKCVRNSHQRISREKKDVCLEGGNLVYEFT